MFFIGEKLGIPVYRLQEEMPFEEVYLWSVWETMKQEAEEKARKKSENASKAKGRR